MKRLIACLTILSSTLALFSCKHDILYSTGVPALSRNSVVRVMRDYKANPPVTERDMSALLQHKPLGSYRDAKGKYSHWGWFEINPGGAIYQNVAGCYSDRKGRIKASCIRRASFWTGEKICGDGSIFDSEENPGMLEASLPFFKKREMCRAAYQKRPVYFSPSGKNSYILQPGEKFLGWRGEEPRVKKSSESPRAPAGGNQESNQSLEYLNLFLDALGSSLANSPSNTYVPQTTPVSSGSNKNQDIIDYWNRKAKEAKEDHERYSKMHWGNSGGFKTN